MRLKFRLIDNFQTGFARYCPTFTKIAKTAKCIWHRMSLSPIQLLERDFYSSDIAIAQKAARALGGYAAIDVQCDEAFAVLMKALESEAEGPRISALVGIKTAKHMGADVSPAIPLIIKSLAGKLLFESSVAEDVINAIVYVPGQNTNHNHKIFVKAFWETSRSNWFRDISERNTKGYVRVIQICGDAMAHIENAGTIGAMHR